MSVLDARFLAALSKLAGGADMGAPLIGAPTRAFIPRMNNTEIETLPDPMLRALSEIYMAERGQAYKPPTHWAKVNPEHARDYAREYDAMLDTPNDPLTAAAYRQMGQETLDQFDLLRDAGYKFDFIPRSMGDPYEASPRLALADLRDNKHMWVFPTEDGYGTLSEAAQANPLLKMVQGRGDAFGGAPFTYNDAFRAVHDAMGHAPVGAGFRASGEENAFRHHASLYSDLARPALGNETRGQNSFVNFSDRFVPEKGMTVAEWNKGKSGADTIYADQKAGTMPDFVYNRGLEDFADPISTQALRRRIEALRALLLATGGGGVMAAINKQREAA